MINEIVLRRRNKITIPEMAICVENIPTHNNDRRVLTVMKNVENLGFTFDRELFNALRFLSVDELDYFYKELISMLRAMAGADKEYDPMYPNFPQQVAEMDDLELYLNAIVHYWTFGLLLPEYEKDERLPLFDNPKLVTLSLGNDNDLWEIFENLLSSKTNISNKDKEDIKNIVENYDDFYDHLPDEIPIKENVAYLCKLLLEESNVRVDAIQKYFKTATDVLRLVTAMSDGDVSLAERTKFRKLKRKERKLVMDLLSGCEHIAEDMFRYKNRWLRVGEIVHPGEYRNGKYQAVRGAFDLIRNEKKPLYLSGRIQKEIENGNIENAVKLIKLHPGEFARQLDKLVRDAENPNYVVNVFAQVANQIATPLLMNVRQHFMNRNTDDAVRVVMPKGLSAKAYTIPAQNKMIDQKICDIIVKICEDALIDQYSSREHLGNVYIDDEFKNYVVPFSQRSASTATKTLTRGSRVKIGDDAEAIRGFIWWTNTDDNYRVDIDLSVLFFDKDWNFLRHVGWTNLREDKFRTYHSGDIINGGKPNGKGVAEFIDFDIDSIANDNAKYAAFSVHSFTCQTFSSLKNVRFGWMEREDVNSGEIFEPSTVEMSMDVNSNSIIAVPVVFDCESKEIIWCDLASSSAYLGYRGNSVEGNITGVVAACYAMANIEKPSLYDALILNVKARGNIVSDRNDADIIFSNDTTKPTKLVVDEVTGDTTEIEKDISIHTVYELDYYMSQIL